MCVLSVCAVTVHSWGKQVGGWTGGWVGERLQLGNRVSRLWKSCQSVCISSAGISVIHRD